MAVNVVIGSVFDDSGIKNAQKQFNSLSKNVDKAFKVAAGAVAVATTALGYLGKKSIDAASDLQESTNAVRVAYGSAADAVLAIGENSATSLGVARNEFNQAAVRFSAFAERVVGSGGDVAGFIKDISQRATDFASVFNIDVAEALRVFQSGLSGEAEPLKRFGINLLDSEVKAYALRAGIIAVGETMTETQKVQARYGLLMESTAKTAGDFANTSDGLANSQRILKASITDLQAEIGSAFLPVVEQLFHEFSAKLLPKLKEIGAFLKSPQGEQAIKDFANAFSLAFDRVFEFINFVMRNSRTIAEFGAVILGVVTSLKVFTTATKVAQGAITLFGIQLAATPIGLLVTGLGLVAAGLTAVQIQSQLASAKLQELEAQGKNTADAFWEVATAGKATREMIPGLEEVNLRTYDMELAAMDARDSFLLLNRVRLTGLASQLDSISNKYNKLPSQFMGADWVKAELAKTKTTKTDITKIDTSGGQSVFATVQGYVKDAQKQFYAAAKRYRESIASARKQYDKSIASAVKRYNDAVVDAEANRDKSLADAAKDHAKNIAQIQRDFAQKQADIIQQSIDRLRSAYKDAVQTNVADLFGTEAVGKSVDNLISALRDKLNASRNLIANASQLAAGGFSQTFIEQIVGAGTATGNELASAILQATPEAQKELQSLFSAIEQESNTGMDSLAKTLYEKTGLATDELKALFAQTGEDLKATLAEAEASYAESQANILITFDEAMSNAAQMRDEAFTSAQQALTEALQEAAQTYYDSLTEIEAAFKEKIDSMKGELAGLESTVASLMAAIGNAQQLAKSVAISTPTVTTTTFPAVSKTTGVVATKTMTTPTVVNVNVKTDQTQSTSQVGKVIANTINKYVAVGGRVYSGLR